MKLKKNPGAKLAVVIASLTALIGTWTLVHRNPPVSADTPVASAPTPASRTTGRASVPAAPAAPPVKRHTRTRVS